SGAEATYLLGTHYLKQSHPLRGAMYFRRLQQKSHHRRHYEPMLNIQLATCWALAGLPTRAEEALVQLKREYPDVQLSVAGKRQSLFRQPAQALNWLADQIGPFSLEVVSNSWPLFRGNSQRNQMSSGKVPYLDSPQWKISQSIEYLDKQISEIRSNTLEKRFPLLPSMQPLVVNETILFRTPTELVAVARKTGEMLWKAPFDDALRHLVRHNKQPLDEAQQQSLTRGLQRRLWNNPTFGTMSSDSHQVYSVEGLGFGDVQIQQRLVIMTDGTQRLDPGYLKSYNTLVAYDLESGKALWEVGGAQNRLANPLAGYFFLGPPLPFGGRLYVIGLENQQTRLLELDAKNGAVVWQITLADRNLTEDLQSKMRQTPFVLPQNRQFKSGATPSSSEGILVCPISDSSFVAVNLTTRSLLWMYDAANQETYANQRMINPWQAPFGGTIPVEEPQTWTDTSVTISGDRVILTPQFSEKILCLDLSTGALQWSLPRGDGLYIAGIAADHVIIVGRSHLSAVRLADGSNIWPEQYIEFPAGAIPSGRGYLSPGKFHLPLTTAEVAVFDLQKGHLEARSHSPTGIIPGNLVNCDDFVISQSATGIYRFTSISSQHQILTDQLKNQSGDARLLAQSGEILLYAGRVLEAVENLRKSQDLKPDANTSRLLAAAIVEGLRIDDQTFLEIAQELGPELAKGQQDASFLRQLIRIYQRSDEHLKAFDSCLRLIKTSSDLQKLEDIAGTRRVRRDRWLAARIKEIWQAADQPTQQAILEKLQPLLAEIKLPHALSLFGELPIVADLQLKAAQAALQQRDLVIAENLLQRVWKTGKPPQQRLAAAQLARLYQQAGRHGVAAKIYRLIAKEYRDEPVIDGKTGAQLVAALTDEDLVKRWLDGDLKWPKKTPQQTETKKSHSTRYRLPVTIRQTAGQLNSAINVDVDSQGRTLTALNGNGKQLWQIKLATPKVSMPFMGPAYNHIQGQLDGNLFFTWLGNRVCAIDGLSPSGKLLWDNPTWSNSHVMAARMPRPIFRGQRLAWQQNRLKAAEAIPIVVCSTCVCYQKDNQLLAVDRFTGKTLWSRDGLSAKSDLFGDDQYLFVTSPDSSHAAVFNILDGDQLGTRELPKQKDRMITLGRQILTWTSNPQAASWTLYDPWSQKLVWKRSFNPVTKPTLVNPQTVATLDPQGQFVVQRVADGKLLLEGSIPKPKAFNDIAVLEDSSQFFLAVNKEDAQANFIPTSSNNGRLVVNGKLHAFDRSSKKLNWTAEIGPQLLTLDQSRNFPVLVFSVQTRKQTGPGKYTSAAEVHCLDKRTGKTIYKKSNTYSNQLVGVEAKPTQQLVELRFRSTLVQLKYGDQPVATSKEKEPGPNNPPQGKGDKQPTKPPTAAEETPADRLKNLFRRLGTPSPPTAPAPAKPDPFR
ncbi:MAG: PQQ-binding-like beta-propeller repeat protein, partial [Pirellulaceae bacterium]